MSKNGFKKFKKNDYSYDDEEYADKPRSHYLDRKRERRVQRALKVKDISALTEEEGVDPIDIEDCIWEREIR
jgi:ribosomal protein L20